jgi:peptidoglycan/xylan/chitin deacetylase (PgdA/CDA1 family)
MNPEKSDLPASRLAILAFHKIGKAQFLRRSRWYISQKTFRRFLLELSVSDWEVISIAVFLKALSTPEILPKRAVLLTFDDGYASLVEYALPSLREFDYPAVAFVPTGLIGRDNEFDRGIEPREAICGWDDLRELQRYGFSIQSHGIQHRSFCSISPNEQEAELRCSKSIVEANLGNPVELFAFPFGHVPAERHRVAELLSRSGYRAAVLFGGGVAAPAADNRYFLPRIAMYPDTDLSRLLGPCG